MVEYTKRQTHLTIMKRPISFLAILAFGAAILQAAPQLYDITLSNAEKFTQCRIAYETDTLIKFTGTDKKGNVVTKEVKASSVLFKKEVATKAPKTEKTKPAEAPKAEEPKETPAATPDTTEEAPAESTATETPAEEPAADAAEEDAPAPVLNSASSREATLNAINARLAEIDKKKGTVTEPSRNFTSRYNSTRSSIEKSLPKLEAACDEIDKLQAEYESLGNKGFNFDIVSDLDRSKYAIDGKAAYDAMVMDMNQKKSSRKIGGLDKFEELRESFQGIPEYPEAYSWYIKTLKDLDRKWEKAISKEEAQRKKLNATKRETQEAKDQSEYDKLEEYLEKNDEHIAQVWYTPGTRNLVMLKGAKNKVEDALRRNERNKPHEQTGKVTGLITRFWASMDKARELMINGNFDAAREELENNEDFKILVRLHKSLLPDEYKKPIQDQRAALHNELKSRINDRKNMQRTLDTKRSALNRLAESTNNHVDRLDSIVMDALDEQSSAAAEAATEEAAETQEEGGEE